MIDPVTTATLWVLWGKLAEPLIAGACKDHLKGKLGKLFTWLEGHGRKDDLQVAYEEALQDAYAVCLEKLLSGLKLMGQSDRDLEQYKTSLEAFIRDEEVAGEMLEAVKDPSNESLPRVKVLRNRWKALEAKALPSDSLWDIVAAGFRSQAKEKSFVTPQLREVLNARNQDRAVELLEQMAGVPVYVREDKYAARMRLKYSPVDLANLMPSYAEDPGRLVIRDVFVPQTVREDPPPVEVPKDLADRVKRKDGKGPDALDDDEEADGRIEKLRASYVAQSPRPVLDVISAAGNRLLVLIGEPGSGKSTLLRYLLLGVLEPPQDAVSGAPLGWTDAFKEAFPLFIELRDFYATRQREGEVSTFLDYVRHLGRAEHWAIDDKWVDQRLRSGPSLVMFDGLDEIFDGGDRGKVIQEIAGFAQAYPQARVVVTSRPVGYHEKKSILREAGFKHFGIQDLDDEQVEAFTRGWFALTFPQDEKAAGQRIGRVLGSVKGSDPIRLLAGNPMLLTIMALLAREQELPRERAAFYRKAVEVLAHHWDANRDLTLPGVDYLRVDDRLELLRLIAMRMQRGEAGLAGNFIHEDDLEEEIKAWFVERFEQPPHEALKAARTMIGQLHERNYILCLRGPRLYGFVHRTFLEYLTAAEYVRLFESEKSLSEDELIELFDRHCGEEEWREVLRLICGQINEQFVGRIVEHLATRTDLDEWNGETALPEFTLAVYCVTEVRNPGRIESAGGRLLDRIVRVATKARAGEDVRKFVMEQLTPACRELGVRWPGRDRLATVALSHVFTFQELSYGEELLLNLIGFVAADRDAVMGLAITDKGTEGGMFLRSEAYRVLAAKWPDETTHKLLTERAVEDQTKYTRVPRFQALAEKWPDETTRKLFTERAVEDEDGYVRRAALRALAEKWPDATTRKLLTECAVDSGLSVEHRGEHCVMLGGMHSEFGRIVATENLDGFGPYLDLLKPVPREHIERAAKEAGIDPADVDAQVASLSAHLGWDITRGAGGRGS